jgi:hypothetical protein
MNINLFKNLPVAIACLSSVAAFAGMDMDSRVSQLEAQMKQVRTSTDNNGFGAKTVSAAPILDEGFDFFVGLGVVYQNASLGGTEYAYSDNDEEIAYPVHGDLRETKDSWNWGINAMVGFNTSLDGYDVRLVNSYFDTNHSTSVQAGLSGDVVPLRFNSYITGATVTDSVDYAKSSLSITYDLLGIELGRDFFLSQHLSVRPNYGLLTSWMWLENKINYTGGDLVNDSVYVQDKSNWWGIGPQFGLDTNWGLGKGWSIFADTKGSLMYGRFQVSHQEEYSASAQPHQPTDIKVYGHRMIPYIQAMIGVAYKYYTESNKQAFRLRAGYNTQYFLGANQMIVPGVYSVTEGDDPSNQTFGRNFNSLQTSGLIVDVALTF